MTDKTLGDSQSKVDLSKGKLLKFDKLKKQDEGSNSEAICQQYLVALEAVLLHGGFQRIDLEFTDSIGVKRELLITIMVR